MKNKFIKKSIITSSILGVAVVSTPAILTSCSVLNKDNQDSLIEFDDIKSMDFVGKLNSKTFIDNDGNEKEGFWLDAKDFKGFENSNPIIDQLHRKIIIDSNGLKSNLIQNEFIPLKKKLTSIDGGEKEVYLKSSSDIQTIEYLTKLIKDINLTNTNLSDPIIGGQLDLIKISQQVDISTRISFIDKYVNENVPINKSKQYSIEMILIPKEQFNWNVQNKNDYKKPLVITISDYVEHVAAYPKLNTSVKLFGSHSGVRENIIYGALAGHGINDSDPTRFKNDLSNKLGIPLDKIENFNNSLKIENYDQAINWIKSISKFSNDEFIYFFVDINGDFVKYDFYWDNIINGIKFNRIDFNIANITPPKSGWTPSVKFEFVFNNKIKNSNDNISWLMDIDNEIKNKNYNGLDQIKLNLELKLL